MIGLISFQQGKTGFYLTDSFRNDGTSAAKESAQLQEVFSRWGDLCELAWSAIRRVLSILARLDHS